MPDEEYLTVEEAADILQVTTRQVHRYGSGPNARIRTRRLGKRVMFHRSDVDTLANDLGVVRSAVERTPKPPKAELIPINEMMLYLRERDQQLNEVQQQLNQALLRIGHLQGQLEQRLLPEDEQSLRQEIVQLQRERERLLQESEQLQAELERQQTERISIEAELERRSQPWWKRIFGT